jgi:hypothetical protein
MFTGILRRFRGLVRQEDYLITRHARQKLWSANLTAFDLESIVLSGRIVSRQRGRAHGDWKWVIEGTTRDGQVAAAVVRLSSTGKLVFITVYRL